MLLTLVLLILGFALVAKGGDLFVDSSIDIAKALNIPKILIGATIVSVGTTAPEMMVSAYASWIGDSGIAVGNAVGSAIANIGLIIGIIGLICVVQINAADFRRRIGWLFSAALLLILCAWSRDVSRLMGLFLVVFASVYLWVDYLKIKSQQKITLNSKDSDRKMLVKPAIRFFVGLIMVIIGSRFLVTSGVSIAKVLGIPSVVIGLTVIAVGTSLPELITGILSARKGHPELAVGNIVGANVLNLTLITGTAALIHPLQLTRFTQIYSFSWLLIFALFLLGIFFKTGKVGKPHAYASLVLYVFYIAGLILVPMI